MHKIVVSTVANVSMEQAWARLSDLSQAHQYVPDLTGTEITTENKQGVGASRYVYSNRAPLIETVTEWHEGQGFKLKLHNDQDDTVPPLFTRATFEYALQAEGEQQTRLTNTFEFEMKWGAFGNLLIKLAKPQVRALQEQIVAGQRLYYETGNKAPRDDVVALLKAGAVDGH
ncbi:MAG: SRPBCC family protein [Gammaproteobacteria bacterium]|nr:SRPBCC family protein [Gammaproteobacteria bacterium]